MADTLTWRGAPRPALVPLDGLYARLEPIEAARHTHGLFAAASAQGADERFRYLAEEPPASLAAMGEWVRKAAESADPLFFAVIDKRTGRAEGRQALMRVDATNGVIEIGHIMWGPAIARTRVATEAFFLFADAIFSLGYRRFEWKCNDLNLPSKQAARRFGFTFEGVFRQHMVTKGQNRDTAWFSIIDGEWPKLRPAFAQWLAPSNFDADGRQLTRLAIGA